MASLPVNQILFGVLLAGTVALLAGVLHLLSFSGAMAAFVVGAFVFGFGGLTFAVPLLVFFFSSSLLSRVGKARKAAANALYEKGGTRDVGQVLANGGVPAVLALIYAFTPQTRATALLYLAAVAAVNADTWATEIGGLVRSRPRLITTLRRVDPGTSGAVTLLGQVAALLGGAAIALAGWAAWPAQSVALLWKPDAAELLAVTWAGFMAAFADSVLGASVQAQFRCERCGAITERAIHCEQPARRVRGWSWLRNDMVNFVTSLLGILFAWVLLSYFVNTV